MNEEKPKELEKEKPKEVTLPSTVPDNPPIQALVGVFYGELQPSVSFERPKETPVDES